MRHHLLLKITCGWVKLNKEPSNDGLITNGCIYWATNFEQSNKWVPVWSIIGQTRREKLGAQQCHTPTVHLNYRVPRISFAL